MEKLVGGEKTNIDSTDVGLSYKIFVLNMIHTFFMHLRQIVKNLMLSMSPSSRATTQRLVAEYKKILDSVRKILKSMAAKVVTDPELKVIEDSESEQKMKGPLIETTVDLPAESTMELVSIFTAMETRYS